MNNEFLLTNISLEQLVETTHRLRNQQIKDGESVELIDSVVNTIIDEHTTDERIKRYLFTVHTEGIEAAHAFFQN